jgi:hypothetical protein
MKTHFITKIALLFSVIIFSGCDNVIDCISDIRPELVAKELDNGRVYQQYSDDVEFEMNNAVTDDYYISEIKISGNLPPGISHAQSSSSTIRFSGKPRTTGTYNFTVKITVDTSVTSDSGSDGTCSNQTSKSYKIVVE